MIYAHHPKLHDDYPGVFARSVVVVNDDFNGDLRDAAEWLRDGIQ